MLPWTAALGYTHYMRQGLVFLDDMKRLQESLEEEFKQQGNFTVKKMNRVFSAIGFDHDHEQNNRVYGGATGIMDNKSTLLEWAQSGPYVAEIVRESSNYLLHQDPDKKFENEFPFKTT